MMRGFRPAPNLDEWQTCSIVRISPVAAPHGCLELRMRSTYKYMSEMGFRESPVWPNTRMGPGRLTCRKHIGFTRGGRVPFFPIPF